MNPIAVFSASRAPAALGIVGRARSLRRQNPPGGAARCGRISWCSANPIQPTSPFPPMPERARAPGLAEAEASNLDQPRRLLDSFRLGQPQLLTSRRRPGRNLSPRPVLRRLTIDQSAMHVEMAGDIDLAMEGVLALPSKKARRCSPCSMEVLAHFRSKTGRERPILLPAASYGEFDLSSTRPKGRFNAR